MEITLPPELEEALARQVASGRYADAAAVIAEAVRTFIAAEEGRDQALAALKQMFAEPDQKP